MNPFKKEKFATKIWFSDNVEWSFKNMLKMMSAVLQQEIKDLVAVSWKREIFDEKFFLDNFELRSTNL